MESLIEFKGVTFRYQEQAQPTLDNVTLSVQTGECVAVAGHNGSGKSTLAKLCNGLLLPESGRVLVGGLDTASESNLLSIRQTVGLVFQNPDNQLVATVVEEDVAFALENLGVPSAEIRRRVDEALHTVGMYDYRLHAPHRLSGGQKQRVAIAGILAMRPRCIVLDEPTAMLDPVGRREVMKTIGDLNHRHGVTVLLITHHMAEAAQCGRMVVMHAGRIVADGKPRDVFAKRDTLRLAGLRPPQTLELMRALEDGGMRFPLEALSDEECAQAIFHAIYHA